MNEIVPESPDRDSETGDENSCVAETPQKEECSQICSAIPIPSLARIRKSLGIIDVNVNAAFTPTNRLSRPSSFDSLARKHAGYKSWRSENESSLRKVRIALFHGDFREREKKRFFLNTKSFYGSNNKLMEKFTPSPESPKILSKPRVRNSRSPFSSNLGQRQSASKRRLGQINCGVGHGVKKPKQKKNLSKNRKESSNGRLQVTVEKGDETKKFFKYKSSNKSETKSCKNKLPKSTYGCKPFPTSTSQLCHTEITTQSTEERRNILEEDFEKSSRLFDTKIRDNAAALEDYNQIIKETNLIYSPPKETSHYIQIVFNELLNNNNGESVQGSSTATVNIASTQNKTDDQERESKQYYLLDNISQKLNMTDTSYSTAQLTHDS